MEIEMNTSGWQAPSLGQFCPSAFRGATPERRDLIRGRLPRGKVVLLAGSGDVGKSWALLQLFEAINSGSQSTSFGGEIVHPKLPSLVLMGEDDWESVDLRLKVIRNGQVSEIDHGAIITAPNVASPMHMVRREYNGEIVATEAYEWLDRTLEKMVQVEGKVGFVAIDTFSTFLPIDANKPEEVQSAMNHFTRLAAKHDVCVIITHHMKKGTTPSDLRSGIRGSTAIVDSVRAAYVMTKLSNEEARAIKQELGIDDDGDIVKLTIEKNNLGLRRSPIFFLRLADGTLLDVSDQLTRTVSTPEDALIEVIKEANAAGRKIMKTGANGVFESKQSTWPSSISSLSRAKIVTLVNDLIASGRLTSDGKLGLSAAT